MVSPLLAALEAKQWAALTPEQQRAYQEKAAAVQSAAFRRQLWNVAIVFVFVLAAFLVAAIHH
jgi:hypothetical protein